MDSVNEPICDCSVLSSAHLFLPLRIICAFIYFLFTIFVSTIIILLKVYHLKSLYFFRYQKSEISLNFTHILGNIVLTSDKLHQIILTLCMHTQREANLVLDKVGACTLNV